LSCPASLEVGRGSILYINDDSPSEILDVIDVVSDTNKRELITGLGVENSNRYSWDQSVDKLVKVYRQYLA